MTVPYTTRCFVYARRAYYHSYMVRSCSMTRVFSRLCKCVLELSNVGFRFGLLFFCSNSLQLLFNVQLYKCCSSVVLVQTIYVCSSVVQCSTLFKLELMWGPRSTEAPGLNQYIKVKKNYKYNSYKLGLRSSWV